jgi:hypothetical protein
VDGQEPLLKVDPALERLIGRPPTRVADALGPMVGS